MTWEAWFTLAITVVCFTLLAKNKPSDVTLVAGVTVLLLAGILTPQEAFSGLANEGVITVAVMYVVVTGMRETGAIAWLAKSALGNPKTVLQGQARLMTVVAGLSAFMNNTPLVAMFIPVVTEWAKKMRFSPSKFMLPLSYAAIVGGLCTMIGTSTNLIVNGLMIDSGQTPFHMFDITWVGVPLVIVTIAYVLIFSRWWLPERKPVAQQFADVRRFTVEMLVEPNSPLIDKTVEQAGLRQLPGLFLVEIERHGHSIPAVSSHEILKENDRLIFAGVVDSVVDLQRIRGLTPATDQLFKLNAPRENRLLVQAVVAPGCRIIGKTIRDGRFRTLYNAAVIAVARDGEQLNMKIGDIVLRAGDTLLLEAPPAFMDQQKNSTDFYLISDIPDSAPLRHNRALLALALLIGMIICATFSWLSMLEAAMLAAGLMIIFGCTSAQTARRAIDWHVIITIAASFGLGIALTKSGAAAAISQVVVASADGIPWLTLLFIYLLCSLLTAILTNNSAAVVMFPIALATAGELNVDFLPFAMAIMVAASAEFATPIGYQCNLMVQGPGGYHFRDYLRFGLPLNLLTGLVGVSVIAWVWPL